MDDPQRSSDPRLNGIQPPFSGKVPSEGAPPESSLDRLPPPMFPPGSRRLQSRGEPRHPEPDGDEGVPADAFIMPDEPIRRSEAAAAKLPPAREAPETGVAGGVGELAALEDADLPLVIASGGDPHLEELMRIVKKLSDTLETRGEAALRATPDMSPFEATLRAYCVGFLAALRGERQG